MGVYSTQVPKSCCESVGTFESTVYSATNVLEPFNSGAVNSFIIIVVSYIV